MNGLPYLDITPALVDSAGAVFPIVCAVLVCLRFYCRRGAECGPGIEDWLVLPALALNFGMGIAVIIASARNTVVSPSVDGEPPERLISKVFWFVAWMQTLALGCVKLSFLFFYRRIFNHKGHGHSFNIVTLVLIVIVTIWSVGFFLGFILICPGHIPAYWDEATRQELCWDTKNFLFAYTWSDVGTDLIIILMPIPMILTLHMQPSRKLAVAAVFAMGVLALAASIVRAVLYVGLLSPSVDENGISSDPGTEDRNGIYWALVETGLSLIAVNLPVLYSLVRHEGVDRIVRSVRSLTSIRSTSSKGSKGSRTRASFEGRNLSGSSYAPLDIELAQYVRKSSNQESETENGSNMDSSHQEVHG
ncbi:hypothetical protein EV356DRAFT_581583 [Viridothelium virens]|uniref:Rhodopsin domain-containing protein n=1 Tax=Viridothelium virens TaxID=1048519 RepID=A0A6A6GS75_VIRVR|nr:hypothetical protein EV356DRAFT_581583 [Viridothelium virens]